MLCVYSQRRTCSWSAWRCPTWRCVCSVYPFSCTTSSPTTGSSARHCAASSSPRSPCPCICRPSPSCSSPSTGASLALHLLRFVADLLHNMLHKLWARSHKVKSLQQINNIPSYQDVVRRVARLVINKSTTNRSSEVWASRHIAISSHSRLHKSLLFGVAYGH